MAVYTNGFFSQETSWNNIESRLEDIALGTGGHELIGEPTAIISNNKASPVYYTDDSSSKFYNKQQVQFQVKHTEDNTRNWYIELVGVSR